MNKLLSFFRFAFVGGFGFIIDGLAFYLLQEWLESALPARLLAFLIAVYATWVGNKYWSFKNYQSRAGIWLYGLLSCCGGGINMAVFFSLQTAIGVWPAFIAGIAAGMLFNFFTYSALVFKQ